MINKYYEDYYRGRIQGKAICKKEGISYYQLEKILKKYNLKTYVSTFNDINTGIKELDRVLKKKYSSVVNRCNGGSSDHYDKYKDMEYLTIMEWVKFCNDSKELLTDMWKEYLQSNKDNKYNISVDRIDNKKGYTVDNIEFVTHGFNSWKRNLKRPIKVKLISGNKWKYFMTCEEGSKYYGLRPQTLGEILRNVKYHNKDYEVIETTIDEVLRNTKTSSIMEYYERFIQ